MERKLTILRVKYTGELIRNQYRKLSGEG